MNGGRNFTVKFHAESDAGRRLDVLTAERYPRFSRSTVARLIREGRIRVNDKPCKPGYKPAAGDRISGEIPESVEADPSLQPEAIPLCIILSDAHCLAVNKPPAMVVHPSPGHFGGTLAGALLYHFPEIQGVGTAPERPGIVHRLDKDTSGVILAAKTPSAFQNLTAQFKNRSVEKHYLALTYGRPQQESGHIDLPIGRHRLNRKKMSASSPTRARQALTFWRLWCFWEGVSLMEYRIATGRTHQIRVHSSAIGCPIVGDSVYGPKKPTRLLHNPKLRGIIQAVPRQMLHAWQIRFLHPEDGRPVCIQAEPANDMQYVLEHLRESSRQDCFTTIPSCRQTER
ncbi:MAG TPA: RluA family pseudouridine synthase [Desulfosalsimonadaceae bacterium]|nr:RluA family pseudouridine synthase [Desulfosalsimonadaceae bacterium]